MARGNADLSRWVVEELSAQRPAPRRIVELGPGPGVGLQHALQTFPQASVWGIDLSPEMISQARGRNRAAVDEGRLKLIIGGVEQLGAIAPIDIVFANHVLYFWHEPTRELETIRGSLAAGGMLALGYQLKQNMPPMAQKYFPRDGHLLYRSDDQVDAVVRAAGFVDIEHRVKGSPDAPEGRLALVTV